MKTQKVFKACLAGTVLMAFGVIFLPRYISRSLDLRSLGRIVLTGRDQFSYMEQSAYDLAANDEGFRHLRDGTGELTLVASFDRQTAKLNGGLVQGVCDQAAEAAGMGMFLGAIGSYAVDPYEKYGIDNDSMAVYGEYMTLPVLTEDQIESAEYYSLTYPSAEDNHVKKMLNFWLLHYTDTLSCDYYFIVNENNYKIYYVWLYTPHAGEAALAQERLAYGEAEDVQEYFQYSMESMVLYYEAEYYESVFWLDAGHPDTLTTVRLYLESREVTAEMRPLPMGRKGYRGIGIGLESLGEYFSPPG